MHMHGTIKKITITHIYAFKLYSLSLLFFYILISFRYTHEFTISFYYFFIEFFDDLFILHFSFFALH